MLTSTSSTWTLGGGNKPTDSFCSLGPRLIFILSAAVVLEGAMRNHPNGNKVQCLWRGRLQVQLCHWDRVKAMKHSLMIAQNWINLEFYGVFFSSLLTWPLSWLVSLSSFIHLPHLVRLLWLITHLIATTHSHRLSVVLMHYRCSVTLQAWSVRLIDWVMHQIPGHTTSTEANYRHGL